VRRSGILYRTTLITGSLKVTGAELQPSIHSEPFLDRVKKMKARFLLFSITAVLLALAGAPLEPAQAQQPATEQSSSPTAMPGEPQASPGRPQGRGRPLFGKISAIQADAIEIVRPDGTKISVKLTSGTEFRKEREPAKISDFKAGDAVIVRTNPSSQDSDKSSGMTALMVALVPPGFVERGGMNGPSGMPGTMGKDFVAGEVKSVEAPKLTVLRTDSVTQTLELNEETSLRRGRDSITMADIQPGDHIFARGAVINDVFVPKGVNVIPPEQWKRMQETNEGRGPRGASPQGSSTPAAPQNPPEQPN
jgi:hypothetical protein